MTGGTPDYQFAWSDGSANSGNSSNISNLSAGLYKVTITDLQDCSTIKEIELKQPEIISISESIKNVNCHGGSDGSINITISGTQNPVLYKWSTSDSLKNINNLKVGTYFVTVTDTLKKCLALDTFQVSQPEPLLLKSDSILNNVCKGDAKGQVSIQIQGGTKNYRYLWSNKDSTSVLTNLTAGNYHYSVTDANHCTLTGSISVNEPTGIKISVDSTKNPKCKEVGDGFISIKVGDNQGPFTVKWSNGENGLKNDSLFSGNYIVKITDSLFCTATDTIKLNANPGFQLPVIEYKDVKCFGDSTGAASVKMDTLVRYLWSTGDTSNIVSKLPAGKYSLIATDKNGCKSIADTINIVQPQPIKSELLTSDTLICPGFRNGILSIKASGGKDALTLKWNTGDTLSKIMSLSPGMYTVTITDKNLCKTTQSYRINTTDTLRISDKKVTDIFCYDTKSGGIEFKVRGGFGSLKYSWSDTSVTGSVLSGLAHGLYSVTVNDQQGCMVTDTFRVNKVDSLW
ncbi:MAG: SprB repeat-containing protein [Saprospiraceae bacterium]|nr:SprB repeat-containing protein [Saprospiraceae bacterium]